ncbi:uncharacterized protein LOC143250478 [Tachypleus tridentatus]|uniref:uncharacterized protein LOC143250478 n=1 Tax=Tachypleus tridentatus TaxID=6853 RepID=UPI003FD51DB0
MALNFILDPVIYVLSRRPYRRELKSLLKPFCLDCYPQLEWINSNGSRTFQRNSGYPWNIGMSAIYCKACQDEMSERHCSKHDHINPIFRVKDQLRHGQIEVRPNQKPVGDESRTSYTECQRKFLESIVVQIRIHDGQNSSVHMWNNKKKQWSKFNRKKCSCCKKNCYRDFFSDDYKTLGRTSVHVTGVSPLNYHSLPESLCKEYLANSCPSSFSNDKKTSDIDLNADTTPISSMTFHKRSNVYKRKSSSQYLSRHSSPEPSSSQLHHSEPTKLGSSTIYYRPKTPFLDISAINQYPLCSTLKYSTAKQRSELFMMRSSTIGHISERIKLTALTSDNHSTHTKMKSLSNGNHSEHISCMSSTTENHVESTKQ